MKIKASKTFEKVFLFSFCIKVRGQNFFSNENKRIEIRIPLDDDY